MSRFAPEMDRNGIQWQQPVGTWKQSQDITQLQTFAENLVIPPDSSDTDLLNSIPTPWSRLLLFENALYSPQHPAHREVLDQWRGLLGLLALAMPLGIQIEPSRDEFVVNLLDFVSSNRIAKTFVDLQPYYLENKVNVESGKWQQFHLIVVDQKLLGATSPRTLVFTAIDHVCPTTIPFKDAAGRLSDPLAYFGRFADLKYLALLKQWIDGFIPALRNNRELDEWLGSPPSASKSVPRRHPQLLGLLTQWQSEISHAIPRSSSLVPVGQPVPLFTLQHYDSLKFLPQTSRSGDSDLLLATSAQKKVVVCFRPDRSQDPMKTSSLYNQHGQLVQSGALLICDGRWIKADEPLPETLDFLLDGWECILDPIAELFEDSIIEVELPDNGSAAHTLSVGKKNFLYPFKEKILEYFTPAELAQFTAIQVDPDSGYRITLQLPLVKGRSVRATRLYEAAANELVLINSKAVDHRSSELAMWPAFAAPDWHYHFYFKRQIAPQGQPARNLDFVPIGVAPARRNPDSTSAWYFTKDPVPAFVGTVAGRSGLLLPKYEQLPPAGEKDLWNVSVDFGSTHTRVFYLQMARSERGNHIRFDGARIEPLEFAAYAKSITDCDPAVLRNNFFALSGELEPPTRVELKTLLMQPVNESSQQPDWRPREGFAFMHWVRDGFDERRLKSDIKWESSGNKNDLNAYLRCLMIMVLAEAATRNAEVLFVRRSFPSAFNNRLQANHNSEWVNLGRLMQVGVESEPKKVLSEAVATARFLASEEKTRVANTTVSLDIGGSTTDIAIWYGKRGRPDGERTKATLGVQESVKMAAGSVGKYLQSDPRARRFLEWFVEAVKAQGVYQSLNLEKFAGRRLGYALMFYDTLTYYELAGDRLKNEFNALVALIKTRDEARGLIVHLIYVFGSLAYYSGVLARKVVAKEKNSSAYYLYFCGKGGTLITWIDNYERFAEKMFLAGLLGPDSPETLPAEAQPRAVIGISPNPKQEVGRGLLVEDRNRALDADDDDSFGLIDPKEPSFTVAESGYKVRENGQSRDLRWDESLDENILASLDNNLPSFDEMKELNCFITAIKEAFQKQKESNPSFDVDRILVGDREKSTYVDRLANRLLGDAEGSILHELEQENNPNALVEPLLITEMKVLLETISNNERLFR